VLNETTVFGGINRRIDSQEFEGGHISAVFGGIELDLRKANTKKDEIIIEADAVFGGIELTVPEHWRVTVQGSGIFGGYDDQTHPSPAASPDEKRPHLIMTGSAVFGGVSVKN
jgi:predicted membrane protein